MGKLLWLRPSLTADYEAALKVAYLASLRDYAGRDTDALLVLRGQACPRDPATLDVLQRARVTGMLRAVTELIEQSELARHAADANP
jgi:hypothetical protein